MNEGGLPKAEKILVERRLELRRGKEKDSWALLQNMLGHSQSAEDLSPQAEIGEVLLSDEINFL